MNNMPSDRVTETGGEVLTQNGGHPFYPWGAGVQDESVELANAGKTYTYILTNSTYGVYGSSEPCGYHLEDLAISSAYGFTPSMVNNTGPASFGSGSKTSAETFVTYVREAEQYWGFAHIDDIGTEGGSSIYAKGWHAGDKIEYLMKFGGTWYKCLQMWVISDIPACVGVNIYVDGMFKAYRDWCHGDNVEYMQSQVIEGLSYGTHAIAFEFAYDYFVYPPYDPDLDRNLFLNKLRVYY